VKAPVKSLIGQHTFTRCKRVVYDLPMKAAARQGAPSPLMGMSDLLCKKVL
jgi:hypothetical protein